MNIPSLDIKDILRFIAIMDDNGDMISDDLDGMLVTDNARYSFGENLFISRQPNKPNKCITLYDTGGAGIDMQLDSARQYQRPAIQIRIRDVDYENATAVAYDMIGILQGMGHQVWNGTYYSLIHLAMGPTMLDYDKNNRAQVFLNFNIQRRNNE